MARKLQIKRGKKANMPTLAEGELGFATDEKSVYIGTGTENVSVAAPLDNTMSDASENGVKNKAIKTYVDSQDAALNTAIGTKVDKVTGKGLSTNDYTTAEKDKLAGIEGNANRYTHPSSHPATMITQDATHRFVSDTEKTAWNGKLPSTGNATLDGVLNIINTDVNGIAGMSTSLITIRRDNLITGIAFLRGDDLTNGLVAIRLNSDMNKLKIESLDQNLNSSTDITGIDISGLKLENAAAPTANTDVANKKYVDDLMLVDTTFEV